MKTWWLVTLLAAILAASGPLLAQAAEPADYRFAPGDVIEITVTPQKGFDRTLTIQPDGIISYPYIGPVRVTGMTAQELAQQLRTALNRDLNEPNVIVSLKELHREQVHQVSVLGAVRLPGTVDIKDGTTIVDVLAAVGGPTALADLTRVTISRADQTVETIDLSNTKTGQVEKNTVLHKGDIIVVPEGTAPNVLVLGEVLKQGSHPIQGKARLLDAISLAGGPTTKGDLRRVTLTRPGDTKPRIFDLHPILFEGSGILDEINILLQPGDTVVVPESTKRVYVLGRVAKPEAYQIKAGDRVLDALIRAGGASAEGDATQAVLVRRDASGQPVTMKMDLKKVMQGKSVQNDLLLPGDVLYVPDKRRRRTPAEFYSLVWSAIGLTSLLGRF